jgi:hypothetical protein
MISKQNSDSYIRIESSMGSSQNLAAENRHLRDQIAQLKRQFLNESLGSPGSSRPVNRVPASLEVLSQMFSMNSNVVQLLMIHDHVNALTVTHFLLVAYD